MYIGGMKNKTIQIMAKCSDLFSALLVEKGKYVGKYSGYVPPWMPGKHYEKYVELEIDLVTGKILNWTPPTEEQLKKTFAPLAT